MCISKIKITYGSTHIRKKTIIKKHCSILFFILNSRSKYFSSQNWCNWDQGITMLNITVGASKLEWFIDNYAFEILTVIQKVHQIWLTIYWTQSLKSKCMPWNPRERERCRENEVKWKGLVMKKKGMLLKWVQRVARSENKHGRNRQIRKKKT
jgi:hypothetical protein